MCPLGRRCASTLGRSYFRVATGPKPLSGVLADHHRDAQAVLRKERADRERRLEALAVGALTALAERDALVRDAEQRAGQALRTMTEGEDLSVREAVDWCCIGVTMREITRLVRLAGGGRGGQNGRVG